MYVGCHGYKTAIFDINRRDSHFTEKVINSQFLIDMLCGGPGELAFFIQKHIRSNFWIYQKRGSVLEPSPPPPPGPFLVKLNFRTLKHRASRVSNFRFLKASITRITSKSQSQKKYLYEWKLKNNGQTSLKMTITVHYCNKRCVIMSYTGMRFQTKF